MIYEHILDLRKREKRNACMFIIGLRFAELIGAENMETDGY